MYFINPIDTFISLPFDLLPNSSYIDFLQFIACDKPAIRIHLQNQHSIKKLVQWCFSHKYAIKVDIDRYACIARNISLVETILEVDQNPKPHEHILGLLLGYPECCSKFVARIGENNIDQLDKQVAYWTFSRKFRYIDPTHYLDGTSLICHVPCSNTCLASLDIALNALRFIQAHLAIPALTPWHYWLNRAEIYL